MQARYNRYIKGIACQKMTNLDTFLSNLMTLFDGFGHKLLTLFDGFSGLALSGIPENSKVKIKIKKVIGWNTRKIGRL